MPSLPGVSRKSIDLLLRDAERCVALGVPAIALFPVIPAAQKSLDAAAAWDPKGLRAAHGARAEGAISRRLGVITDVALDPYTSHGQDGLLDDTGYVVNDETVAALTRQALCHAEAGVDIVAPSDMMDGRIGALRAALDRRRASTGRGSSRIRPSTRRRSTGRFAMPSARRPAWAAATNTPTRWTRRTATRRCGKSISTSQEGADMVMVKPGLPYLDIVRRVKDAFGVPTAVYQVSGEYAMLKAAAANGWLDERACVLEALIAFKRAGADAILTYFALTAAAWLQGVITTPDPLRLRRSPTATSSRDSDSRSSSLRRGRLRRCCGETMSRRTAAAPRPASRRAPGAVPLAGAAAV